LIASASCHWVATPARARQPTVLSELEIRQSDESGVFNYSGYAGSAAAFNSLNPVEIPLLIVRVQAAGIWQHPEYCVTDSFLLASNSRLSSAKGGAISAEAEQGEKVWFVPPHFRG